MNEKRYQIYGNSTGSINVYVSSALNINLIGSISTNNQQILEWKYFKVLLPTCSNQFQIVLEGIRGNSISITNTSFYQVK
jgi:hypothetical protein